MHFFNLYWKLIPSYIFFFLGQPLISALRKQEGYKYATCLNSRWVVLLRSTRNLWKPLYSSIGFECHQFNLNATTPPNKARFTLLEARISSWSFASLNIHNLSWWDGGHVQCWVSEKNSITFGKLSGKGLYQDDYWLRAVTTWNFLQLNLCWNYIFLASSEYIDLEMNFKSERVYIFTIRWYFALCWARLSLVLKTILSLSQGCPNEKFHLFWKFLQTQSPIKWTWQR